jgi:hypothetical protein
VSAHLPCCSPSPAPGAPTTAAAPWPAPSQHAAQHQAQPPPAARQLPALPLGRVMLQLGQQVVVVGRWRRCPPADAALWHHHHLLPCRWHPTLGGSSQPPAVPAAAAAWVVPAAKATVGRAQPRPAAAAAVQHLRHLSLHQGALQVQQTQRLAAPAPVTTGVTPPAAAMALARGSGRWWGAAPVGA